MKIIGVTGGVGCGKSELLRYLEEKYPCVVVRTDETAKELELPGGLCYEALVSLLRNAEKNEFQDPACLSRAGNSELILPDGRINPQEMAARIFRDRQLLAEVNALIHPAVEHAVLARIADAADSGKYRFFFIEAALLIEAGYEKYLDGLWYIFCDERVRRERLRVSRGYSDEKTDSILKSQLPDEVFRQHADAVIDNSGTLPSAFRQIDRLIAVFEQDEQIPDNNKYNGA